MVCHTFGTLLALAAAAYSEAIVTNLCSHDVYIWSVPEAPGYAENLLVRPGHKYEEPFRYGTKRNPGVAIKVSASSHGINNGAPELDFAYAVNQHINKTVWVNLDGVRDAGLIEYVTFFTCVGQEQSLHAPTRRCSTLDDIELVLCGTERTGPIRNPVRSELISNCSTPIRSRDHSKEPSQPAAQCNPRVILSNTPTPSNNPRGQDMETPRNITQLLAQDRTNCTEITVKDIITKRCECRSDTRDLTCSCDGKTIQRTCTALDKRSKKGDARRFCEVVDSVGILPRCDPKWVKKHAKEIWDDLCPSAPKADCATLKKEVKARFPDLFKHYKTLQVASDNVDDWKRGSNQSSTGKGTNTDDHDLIDDIVRYCDDFELEECDLDWVYKHTDGILAQLCSHYPKARCSVIETLLKARYPTLFDQDTDSDFDGDSGL